MIRGAALFVGLYLAAAAAVSLAAVAVLNHLDGRLVPY